MGEKTVFAHQIVGSTFRLPLFLNRKSSGISYFLPQFDAVFKDDFKHVISCKKKLGASFEYGISVSQMKFNEDNPLYLGRLYANFTNTVFNLEKITRDGNKTLSK